VHKYRIQEKKTKIKRECAETEDSAQGPSLPRQSQAGTESTKVLTQEENRIDRMDRIDR